MPEEIVISSVLQFGPFECRPGERLLLEGGKPLQLGGRALDILLVLLEQPGKVVSKNELLSRVWPNVTVGEGALRVHIAALRRTFKERQADQRYISSVAGRGYAFVAAVCGDSGSLSMSAKPPQFSLPVVQGRVFGRDATVQALVAKLAKSRFVTLAGPGGVGKTTVALTTAELSTTGYRDGVVFVDVAAVDEPSLLSSALASALGVPSRQQEVVPALQAFLRHKNLLVILDGCERVIEAAAALAEALVSGLPGISVLATSREPLRANGETVQRISPLSLPPLNADKLATSLFDYPAVQLFVERAAAAQESFVLSHDNSSVVVDICRRLDGMPLAIELVAARVDAIGLHGLLSLLDDRLRLLTSLGRRTAQTRHRTLQAALDWSYQLLSPLERLTFQRLGVFSGSIDQDGAYAVASDVETSVSDFGEMMASLVSKSLIAADVDGAAIKYRLLDTTRYYALEKLSKSGKMAEISQRHARYFTSLFTIAAATAEAQPAKDWLETYGAQISNVRAALDWAFSEAGDQSTGIELTIVSAPLWTRLLLLRECRSRLERALAVPAQLRSDQANLRLFAGLGAISGHADSTTPELFGAWWKVLHLAEQLGEKDFQVRALWGIWVEMLQEGQFREAFGIAQKFQALARMMDDAGLALVADRLAGYTLHFLGDQGGARKLIEHMLINYPEASRKAHAYRFQFDQPVTARITLAWVLWLQGFPDQALESTKRNIQDAIQIDHPLSLGNALAKSACPIALLTGNLGLAQRLIALFTEHTRPDAIAIWQPLSRCFEGLLAIARGDIGSGLETVMAMLDQSHMGRFTLPYSWVVGEMALAQAKLGQVYLGKQNIMKAIAQAERDHERWCFAELLRVKGEIALCEGGPGAVEQAEHDFMRSLDVARDQQVLAWELRSATSLARLMRNSGRPDAAAEQLCFVYSRFSEGFQTADLVAARCLITDLGRLSSPPV